MVSRIYDAKARVLSYMDSEFEKYGKDRMDVNEMERLADVVKDLSEAEKLCWEAEYYRSITEAMGDGQGYGMGYGPQGGQMGYNPNRDSMGRYSHGRRGYGMGYHEHMEDIRTAMQSASPEEREKMKRELRQMAES